MGRDGKSINIAPLLKRDVKAEMEREGREGDGRDI